MSCWKKEWGKTKANPFGLLEGTEQGPKEASRKQQCPCGSPEAAGDTCALPPVTNPPKNRKTKDIMMNFQKTNLGDATWSEIVASYFWSSRVLSFIR
jgi:hypothetical protein